MVVIVIVVTQDYIYQRQTIMVWNMDEMYGLTSRIKKLNTVYDYNNNNNNIIKIIYLQTHPLYIIYKICY